jgi:hypothetical protein
MFLKNCNTLRRLVLHLSAHAHSQTAMRSVTETAKDSPAQQIVLRIAFSQRIVLDIENMRTFVPTILHTKYENLLIPGHFSFLSTWLSVVPVMCVYTTDGGTREGIFISTRIDTDDSTRSHSFFYSCMEQRVAQTQHEQTDNISAAILYLCTLHAAVIGRRGEGGGEGRGGCEQIVIVWIQQHRALALSLYSIVETEQKSNAELGMHHPPLTGGNMNLNTNHHTHSQ